VDKVDREEVYLHLSITSPLKIVISIRLRLPFHSVSDFCKCWSKLWLDQNWLIQQHEAQ